jgi:Cu/Ag efflux protein CusF
MKKATAILAVMVLVVSLFSLAFAADAMKGTVKSIDAKAGTMVLTTDSGKDETLTADKAADLSTVKAGDKVIATMDKGKIASLMVEGAAAAPAKRKNKSAVGC